MNQKIYLANDENKGFTLVEIVVVIAIMLVLLAILAPSLLRYTENSRMQKDDSAMDELCGTVQLALADAEIFDEACSYAIPNNYITYTDSSGVYGAKYVDEEFWAPDGSGNAVTITFNPDNNGNYTIANGLVNDMTYGNGSVADSRTADNLKQCYFSEMGDGKLYHKVEQTFGSTFNEKSATYQNSSYTVFIKLDVVDGIKRTNVYGEWNGTNLDESCPASLGSGTSSYTEDEEPEQTKTGGTTQSNFTSSDLQGSGGASGNPLPSYKQCTHEIWVASDTNTQVHICAQCHTEAPHEYEEMTTATPNCTEDQVITKECKVCHATITETKKAGHTFDDANDLTCNVCNTKFTAYHFRPSDYDSKMKTTTATDAIVVIPGTFEYGRTKYKTVTIAQTAFKNNQYVEEVIVPDTVGNLLYPGVFYSCRNLKKVQLPDSITNIPTETFYCCTSLTSVNFPKNLKTISASAFYYCDSLINIDLTHCEQLTTIGKSAFIYSSNIQKVSIPNSLTTIDQSAFMDCESLKEFNFAPNGQLSSIGYQCFFRCYALEKVQCPNNLTTIKGRAFANCTALESITFNNNLVTIEEQSFSNCQKLQSIVIPNTVKSIGWSAFDDCIGLSSVDLGTGVETMGSWVFSNTAITDITIPYSVNTMGANIFSDCTKLSNVNLPDKDIQFDSYTFDSCTSLTTITLPAEITNIPFGMFDECTALNSIVFKGTVDQWNTIPRGERWIYRAPVSKIVCSDGTVNL